MVSASSVSIGLRSIAPAYTEPAVDSELLRRSVRSAAGGRHSVQRASNAAASKSGHSCSVKYSSVGQVPKQEIADALLAPGANEKGRICEPCSGQAGGEAGSSIAAAGSSRFHLLAGGARARYRASAVAESILQTTSANFPRHLLRSSPCWRAAAASELGALAVKAHPHAAAVQFLDLGLQRLDEQPHQAHDLHRAATPVLAADANNVSAPICGARTPRSRCAPASRRRDDHRRASPRARAPNGHCVHDDGHVTGQRGRAKPGERCSNLKNFLFLGRQQLIDLGDVPIGQFLDLFLPALVVLAIAFLEHFLDVARHRGARWHADARVLASWRTTLLMSRRRSRSRRQRMRSPHAVLGEAEVGLVDRLLDRRLVFSHGDTTSVRASSTLMFATCCSGTSEP